MRAATRTWTAFAVVAALLLLTLAEATGQSTRATEKRGRQRQPAPPGTTAGAGRRDIHAGTVRAFGSLALPRAPR
jgi:hypothetical protein